ncbi:MAG TPA: YXWGXW repeat-containing protein [Polyangiaceae bacterium]|nr:YXWGXW repeat-containing protein [Polyangiaceae bacterium]
MRFVIRTAAVPLAAALAVVAACAGSLPRPAYVAQTTDALAPVPYPPPPARVETVPAEPRPGAVWIDGEWVWQGRLFAWRRGRWVMPPEGARFAPWTTVRGEDGTVYFAGGTWRDARNQLVPDPPALAVAKSTGGAIIDLEGHEEVTGHTVRESQGAGSAAETDGGTETQAAPGDDAGDAMAD